MKCRTNTRAGKQGDMPTNDKLVGGVVWDDLTK